MKELELSLGQEDLFCPWEGLLPVPEASARLLAWVGVCGGYREGWCSCVSTVDNQMRMKSREVQPWAQHPWSLSRELAWDPGMAPECGGGGEGVESTCHYPLLTHTHSLYPFFTPSHLPSFLPPSFLLPCPSLLIPPPSLSLTKHSPSAPWVPEKGHSRDEAQLLCG